MARTPITTGSRSAGRILGPAFVVGSDGRRTAIDVPLDEDVARGAPSSEEVSAFVRALCDLVGLKDGSDLAAINRFPFAECAAPPMNYRALGALRSGALNVGFAIVSALRLDAPHHVEALQEMAALAARQRASSDQVARQARTLVDTYAPRAREGAPHAAYWQKAFVWELRTFVSVAFGSLSQDQADRIARLLAKHTDDPRKARRGGPYTSLGIVTHLYRDFGLFGHPGKRSFEASQRVIAAAIKRASTPLRKK